MEDGRRGTEGRVEVEGGRRWRLEVEAERMRFNLLGWFHWLVEEARLKVKGSRAMCWIG